MNGTTTALLREAAALRLLALLFERPTPGKLQDRVRLGAEQADAELTSALGAAGPLEEGAYLTVFGPGGIVSPREVSWRGRVDPGEILADLGAFYEAFAYSPVAEDPNDHIAVELGFVAYLRLKEAFACAKGDAELAALAREATVRFLDAHLRRWAGLFKRRLAELGVVELLPAAEALCTRVGPCLETNDAAEEGLDVDALSSACEGLACGDGCARESRGTEAEFPV